MSNGSQTTLTDYQWASSGNEVTTIIPAATINTNNVGITTTNMTIPTGGTFQGQAQTLTLSGDFTTSGGLLGASCLTPVSYTHLTLPTT